MTKKQIWQTIGLDLKRAANYLNEGRKRQSDYYLAEAKSLFEQQTLEGTMKTVRPFIKFEGCAEDILLSGTIILSRT